MSKIHIHPKSWTSMLLVSVALKEHCKLLHFSMSATLHNKSICFCIWKQIWIDMIKMLGISFWHVLVSDLMKKRTCLEWIMWSLQFRKASVTRSAINIHFWKITLKLSSQRRKAWELQNGMWMCSIKILYLLNQAQVLLPDIAWIYSLMAIFDLWNPRNIFWSILMSLLLFQPRSYRNPDR